MKIKSLCFVAKDDLPAASQRTMFNERRGSSGGFQAVNLANETGSYLLMLDLLFFHGVPAKKTNGTYSFCVAFMHVLHQFLN
ncbi:hypothetical protein QYF36_010527 [Acer negundo]|nr:hypothetical protein QYF36_010527 [Acer negundo]